MVVRVVSEVDSACSGYWDTVVSLEIAGELETSGAKIDDEEAVTLSSGFG